MDDDMRYDDDEMRDSDDSRMFEAIMIVSMQRIYDLLLFDIKQQYGDAAAKLILDQHSRHQYMYPGPGARGPADDRTDDE